MGKPHPVELRERVVSFVDEGHGHREAARHFRVSPRFVNDMIKLRRETGGLSPKRQGNPGRGKLTAVADWVRARLAKKGDLTLDALVAELKATQGIAAHRSSVGRLLHRLGLSHKKRPAGRRTGAPGCGAEAAGLATSAPALHGQASGALGLSG